MQSLTPTPLKHLGPLKGGPKTSPFSEPPWCPSNIHTQARRAATSRSIHAQGNLADHFIMFSTHGVSHKPHYEQSGWDAVA